MIKKCRHKYYIKYIIYCTIYNMDGGGNCYFGGKREETVVEPGCSAAKAT